MKKVLSIFLCIVMSIGIFAPAIFSAEVCNCNLPPVIYIRGRAAIFAEKDQPVNTEENPELPYLPDGLLGEAVKELLPVFATATITDDYTQWAEGLAAVFAEVYADYALDENGEVDNNSGIEWRWNPSNIKDKHIVTGELSTPNQAFEYVYRYFFQYDGRIDPLEVAKELHDYIEAVKAATGHDKVKIIARCLGSNIFSAYIATYGWDDITDVVIYNPIMNGTSVTNELFSGNIHLDATAVDFFANQQLENDPLMSFIKSFITLSNKMQGLDIGAYALNKIIAKVANIVVPMIMKDSYGTSPGFWSMVSADRYEEARDFIFSTEEDRIKYKSLIEKLDNYHEKVSSKLEELYTQMAEDGVNVYFIVKYGYQLYPVIENSQHQSDMIVTVQQQSMGCVAADMGETLSDEYIALAEENGKGNYISPDCVIDASTGIFPDTTWYIKNIDHNNYPKVVDALMAYILNRDTSNPVDVNSDPMYPQFLNYEGEQNNGDVLVAQTKENPGAGLEDISLFNALIEFFRKLIAYIKILFEGIAVA